MPDVSAAQAPEPPGADHAAVRAVVSGAVQGVGFRAATVTQARAAGAMGWVRNEDDGTVALHAEGPRAALETLLAFLRTGPRGARVAALEVTPAKVEGHEQFAVRGVSAGAFAVVRQPRGFLLRLDVAGTAWAWSLPKGPSMDPADKRLALELPRRDSAAARPNRDTEPGGPSREGPAARPDATDPRTGGEVWDSGPYEQGGRVPWPQALERGHAVFVLHGELLRGGFALQRTGREERWLLVKRRDDHARPGSDVVAEAASGQRARS